MKIALLYHQFVRSGGLEGYLAAFTARLRSAGHPLTLVTTRLDADQRHVADEVRLISPGLTKSGTLQRFARESARLVPQLGADVVLGFGRTWCQDIHRAGGGCHAVYSRLLPWWKRWRPKNRGELALERRLYTGGQTRIFVVNSHRVAEELRQNYQVPAERIRVIRTAVDSTAWLPAADPAERERTRAAHGSPGGRPVLLFASLDHRRKGLDLLLEAAQRFPDAVLWVAGKPLDAWQGRIRQAGLEGRIHALGRRNLLPFYQAADWFVHPTRYDACANTVLQSMSCGLPGIISPADGAVEFVRPGENGLAMATVDAASLTDSLTEALAISPDQRAAMGRAARRTAQALTWDAHVEDWMRVIAEVQASRGTARVSDL